MTLDIERDARGIKCPHCGGYAELVDTTPAEVAELGCGAPGESPCDYDTSDMATLRLKILSGMGPKKANLTQREEAALIALTKEEIYGLIGCIPHRILNPDI